MMRHAVTAIVLAAAVAGAPASSQGIDPKVLSGLFSADKAKKVLDEPLKLQTFTWTRYDAPTVLPPVATHLCVITAFTGKLGGAGEVVRLYTDNAAKGGARFMLGGQATDELRVTASCAAKAQFVGAHVIDAPDEEVSGVEARSGCTEQVVKTNPTIKPSALFLAGFGGRFGGTGEAVRAVTTLFGPTTLISACSGPVSAAVLAIGSKPAAQPVYRDATSRTVNAGKATFTHQWGHHFDESGPRFIIPADDALCGLTAISGKFNGYGQFISLGIATMNGQRWWELMTGYDSKSDPDTAFVQASARCYARDQRPVS